MSYISLLQEHATNLKNNIDAGREREDVGASQKAQDLQEKYQQVLDHYNAGAGAISTLSGAFHQGRKVYKGLVKNQAQKTANAATARTSTPAELTETSTPQAEAEAQPAPARGDEEGTVPSKATEVQPSGPIGTATDDPADIGNRLDRMVQEATPDPQANPNVRGGRGFKNLVERGARQAPFQGNKNFPVAAADEFESDVRQTPLTPSQRRLVADPDAERPSPASRLIDAGGPDAGSARHSPLSGTRNPNVPDTLEGDIGNQGGKTLSSTFVRKGASEAAEEGASAIGKVLPKAASTANTISQTASKVAGSIGTEGLEAGAMTALDAIPIVGELAGAGLGLYSLFHGLADKPPSAQDELAKEPTAAEGSSIDTTALLGKT